ncbi:RES family NAD+ phosphorylase [Pseudomonas putida]
MNEPDTEAVQRFLFEREDVWVKLKAKTALFRVTGYPSAIFYHPGSISRYSDPEQEVGVCYVAGSPEVAIAETFQSGREGHGSPVLVAEIRNASLHRLETARPLKLVDVQRLSSYLGGKLGAITEARGQGESGYSVTQQLSGICMRSDSEIDGLIYSSVAYGRALSMEGHNLVLFEGRSTQLQAISALPVASVMLPGNITALELLLRLKVNVV